MPTPCSRYSKFRVLFFLLSCVACFDVNLRCISPVPICMLNSSYTDAPLLAQIENHQKGLNKAPAVSWRCRSPPHADAVKGRLKMSTALLFSPSANSKIRLGSCCSSALIAGIASWKNAHFACTRSLHRKQVLLCCAFMDVTM